MPPEPLPSTPPPGRGAWLLASALWLATLITTTTCGVLWLEGRAASDLPWTSPQVLLRVWTDPQLRAAGLAYALPLLVILLCHELGHYLTCRHYQLPATPPFFLPAPFGLGTLGAFIRIRQPIRSKRVLFDVGIGGPLAGFVALLPFLVYGIAHSRPELPAAGEQLVLGENLAALLLRHAFHGALPAGYGLHLHPFALAAWVGQLATTLNLLPLGQLDGGHVLYAVAGRWQRRLMVPLWGLLALGGLLWPGWGLWALIALALGLRHPQVRDEAMPLDRRRLLLAGLALVIFVLCWMPVPVAVVGP